MQCDLRWLFESAETQASRERVLDYLAKLYAGYAFLTREETAKPNTIVEEFYPPMPTVEAWISEQALCDGIALHSSGAIDDAGMKERLLDFVEHHTFVHEPDGTRKIKKGDIAKLTRDTPLWSFSWDRAGRRFEFVCNAVQIWLLYLLEQHSGDGGDFECKPLQ